MNFSKFIGDVKAGIEKEIKSKIYNINPEFLHHMTIQVVSQDKDGLERKDDNPNHETVCVLHLKESLVSVNNFEFLTFLSFLRDNDMRALSFWDTENQLDVFYLLKIMVDFKVKLKRENLKAVSHRPISLIDIVFAKEFMFVDNITSTPFVIQHCVFQNEAWFNESRFEKTFKLTDIIFWKEVDFNRCYWDNAVLLDNVTFLEKSFFSNTYLLNQFRIKNCIFEDICLFLNCHTSEQTRVSFLRINFKKGVDLSMSNLSSLMTFWQVKVNIPRYLSKDFFSFKHIYLDLSFSPRILLQNLRESCRIIKHTLRSQNNVIDSYEFHRLEMNLYGRELRKNFPKDFRKSVQFVFNSISNSHGTNALKGFVFTMVVGLLFYWLYIISVFSIITYVWQDHRILETFFKDFAHFMNISDWKLEAISEKKSWASFPILLVGRVFIGYGIYQFITAFRRFGKN